MIYGLNMGIGIRPWSGKNPDPRQFAFRCLAAGGRIGFTGRHGQIETWRGWLRDLNRLHRRLLPIAGKRLLLPADRGILWEQDHGRRTLFVFRPFVYETGAKASAMEVRAQGDRPLAVEAGRLPVRPWRVYRIEAAAGQAR